jgi:hypothetical protein
MLNKNKITIQEMILFFGKLYEKMSQNSLTNRI